MTLRTTFSICLFSSIPRASRTRIISETKFHMEPRMFAFDDAPLSPFLLTKPSLWRQEFCAGSSEQEIAKKLPTRGKAQLNAQRLRFWWSDYDIRCCQAANFLRLHNVDNETLQQTAPELVNEVRMHLVSRGLAPLSTFTLNNPQSTSLAFGNA